MSEAGREDVWARLRQWTPARIGLGRVGESLPTRALLEFELAHARARDAVHAGFDAEGLAAELRAAGLGEAVLVRSQARDRREYLLRPDLGRVLDEESRERLRRAVYPPMSQNQGGLAGTDRPGDCAARLSVSRDAMEEATGVSGGAVSGVCGLAVVVGDGLSAVAAMRHAAPLLREMLPKSYILPEPDGGVRVVVASLARVALGDAIGELLGAEAVLVLIGERPGLSSPDSLGAYLTWAPRVGRTDAERNCISNIRPEGLPYAAAARRLRYLLGEVRRLRLSGVALKDDSDQRSQISVQGGEEGGG